MYVLSVSLVTLMALGLRVQSTAPLPIQHQRLSSAVKGQGHVSKSQSAAALSSQSAYHAGTEQHAKTPANDEEDIFDFVEKTLQRIREKKKLEAMSAIRKQQEELKKQQQQQEEPLPPDLPSPESSKQRPPVLDSFIFVGPHPHSKSSGGEQRLAPTQAPVVGNSRGHTGPSRVPPSDSKDVLRIHERPAPGVVNRGLKYAAAGKAQSQSSSVHSTANSSNSTAPTKPCALHVAISQ